MASYEFNPIVILDTTNSEGNGSGGSLTVGGGVSVGKDTYIGGNIHVSGTSASFADNILVLNTSPSDSFDTGILLNRFTNDVNNNNNFAGMIYSEQTDEFCFGYANSDTRGSISLNALIPIRTGGLVVSGGSVLTSLTASNILSSSFTTETSTVGTLFATSSVSSANVLAPNMQAISFTTGNGVFNTSLTTGTLLARTSVSSANVLATNISTVSLRASSAVTTGNILLNGTLLQFGSSGASDTQVFINIRDNQALRFGSDTIAKTHVLVVGESFTNGGRISARYSNYSSWEYVNGTNATIRMLLTTSGNVGIGTSSPSYQLHLSTDSAAKPSTSTWTISSDYRLKSNVTMANLDTCYDTVKNLALKRYTWRNDVFSDDEVTDRSKLGWIAQDVEGIFPKAVNQINSFGLSDCRTLNSDQIYATLYGCVQKLMNKIETLEDNFQTLLLKVQTLENKQTP